MIVSYSTGIDSTGALYWAMQNFAPERIYLLYCDTGAEYPINGELFYKTAAILKVKPVLLREPRGFLGLLEARKRWPDSNCSRHTSSLLYPLAYKKAGSHF